VGLIRSRSVLLSEYWFIEVVPPEVSKSAALAFLGTLYGIDRSEMISVGDNFNDMDMIAWTGLGVAVDNAPDEVKALADVIAPSNDDEGVACIIEKYLLD
jgi:hydroxymethylpyrimidine pyrophosphatase-like HAD family hydrolase